MSQADSQIPINQSGATYRADDNAGKKAILNHHKASSAPSYAETGIIWIDDTSTPWLLKTYDGASWIVLGEIDATAHTFNPYIGAAADRVLNHATDTGAANAYAIAPVPPITAYVTGQVVTLKPTHANTTASTINVNSLGTKNIKLLDGTDPVANNLLTAGTYIVIYDGTNFVLQNPSGAGSTQPTTQYLTSGSSATYTTPANCKKIKVRMIGSGGGGGGTGGTTGPTGAQGQTTSFNSINALSGGGGVGSTNSAANKAGGIGGTGGSGSAALRIAGGNGEGVAGGLAGLCGSGGSGVFGGGGGETSTGTGTAGAANTGGGGSGASWTNGVTYGAAGGGAGEYVEFFITSPAGTYTYTVGSGGGGGIGTGTSALTGGVGGTGFIIVEEYY